MSDVLMPRLSDGMEEGTIIAWLKPDGDEVAAGEDLVEIETDKASAVFESPGAGFLQVLADVGETVRVGVPIAVLSSQPGEIVERGDRAPAPVSQSPSPHSAVEVAGADVAAPPSALKRIKASPLARRLAQENGLELSSVSGSGRGGRVVVADIEAALAVARGEAGQQVEFAPGDGAGNSHPRVTPVGAQGLEPPPGERTTAKGDVQIVELTRAQAVIARRMSESRATIPDFNVTLELDAEPLVLLRETLRGGPEVVPSVNDFVIRATALALRQHPVANARYVEGRFERYSRVNIGIAVAGADSLVVPTIFDADMKSVGSIAQESRALAERVRAGTITPPELAGGTFTVSNLGMYGVTRFSAVINAGQAAILAVGGALERAVPDGTGGLRSGHVMELTLSADHRILYGAEVAAFLVTIRDLLQRPPRLML